MISKYIDGGIPFPQKVHDVRNLVGYKISYVSRGDIGRVYASIRKGVVREAIGREVCIGDDWYEISSIIEYAKEQG